MGFGIKIFVKTCHDMLWGDLCLAVNVNLLINMMNTIALQIIPDLNV